jgi:hypothetical protein
VVVDCAHPTSPPPRLLMKLQSALDPTTRSYLPASIHWVQPTASISGHLPALHTIYPLHPPTTPGLPPLL